MKIKLKTIIANFLSSKDTSSHEFVRLWNIGVRGCRQFNMDILGALETVVLDVNANKTVNLPQNYLQYSKVGVFNGNGEVITFKRNENLNNYNAIYTSQARYSGQPMVQGGNIFSPTVFPNVYFNFWNGGAAYNLFGLPSGTATIGQFDIDEDAGVILLEPTCAYTQIVFEFISTGLNLNIDDYEIDVRAEEAMMCYLRWQNSVDLNKKFSAAQVQNNRREYYREKGLAQRRINPTVIAEMSQIRRSLTKLVARG